MSMRDRVNALSARLREGHTTVAIVVFKALAFAFLTFTFMSGLVLVDGPIAMNVVNHVRWHVVAPAVVWVSQQGEFSAALVWVMQLTGLATILWVTRSWAVLGLGYLWIGVLEVRLWVTRRLDGSEFASPRDTTMGAGAKADGSGGSMRVVLSEPDVNVARKRPEVAARARETNVVAG